MVVELKGCSCGGVGGRYVHVCNNGGRALCLQCVCVFCIILAENIWW